MNSAQAKKIPLFDVLAKLGFSPADTRKAGNEMWYCSPFRNEAEPSFKLKLDDNIWFDFGEGEGGNVIDFVMKYKHCVFTDALSFLSENSNTQQGLVKRAVADLATTPVLNLFDNKSPLILEVKPVYHFALKEYLRERGIAADVGLKHLKELHYQVNDKEYFGLGFANDSGGWETRSAVFKGCIGKKDLTLIKKASDSVSVFEGFMDYLSVLTMRKGEEIDGDVIILNSTSMKGRAVLLMKEKNYRQIDTYMDNDKGGLAVHDFICSEVKGVAVNPKNALYMPYKDVNDFLNVKRSKQI